MRRPIAAERTPTAKASSAPAAIAATTRKRKRFRNNTRISSSREKHNYYFIRADSGIISEPFAFIRSGNYSWSSTSLGNRNSVGYYWSLHTYSTMPSRYQYFYSTVFNSEGGGHKGYGFAVRCVVQ